MRRNLVTLIAVVGAWCALAGCDPLTVHKVTSTIFDGVPSLPPADQYCQEFHEKSTAEEKLAGLKAADGKKGDGTGSSHPPYKEKRCDNCHDKSKESGLIKPKDEICFVCHPNILKGPMAHGPAAVGSCLECHDPHSSAFPSLLKVEKAKVCSACHKEQRLAQGMHDKVTATGLFCMDCHNPHAGQPKYLLR